MKRLALLLLLIAQLSIINCQLSIAQIGTWRAFMSYYEPQQIIKAGSNTLFVRASNSLYSYHLNDHSITTYDKVNTLSDTYISYIAWSQQAKRLIIVYQNGNIDLMDLQENVTNISSLYTKTLTESKTVNNVYIHQQYAYLCMPFGVIKNSDYDRYIDLVKTLKPDGPQFNYFGFMIFSNNRLYGCNGDFNHDYPIQILNNNAWTIYQHEGISEQTGVSFQGAFCLDVDPSNPDHIFAGSRNGLYEYLNGQFIKYYDNSNSPIEPFDGVNKDYQLVTGTKFDSQGNLWFLNSSAPTTALVKYHNGTFTKLNHSELMKLNTGQIKNRSNAELSKMIIDSKGKMWFANNNWVTPAIYQYDLENDKITAYENFVNQDGIIINIHEGVRCVVEDLEQNIWVGTSMGLLLLEKSEIENNGNVFTQVKVPRNDGTNNADYLLANVDISSIAIDGGNRKWIGTLNNGVYLISADNMTQIHHFTTSNSKLLSNAVLSIAINPTSGEVFFATDKGLCSYVSDATAPNTEMTTDNVRAYPNPVEPGYSGPITISGLSLDADVKILTTNGVVVNQGRSNGGTYVWDGCDQKGRRVASGIYMVATATSKGEKGTVCKIAIVR